MNKDIGVYLEDILESISRIEEYTKDINFEQFESSIQLQDAVIRRFEIIGEAVKSIPDEVKDKYPTIPWKQIAGMRDVLIHEYAGVRLERIWKVVTDDLVGFKKVIRQIRSHL